MSKGKGRQVDPSLLSIGSILTRDEEEEVTRALKGLEGEQPSNEMLRGSNRFFPLPVDPMPLATLLEETVSEAEAPI